MLSCPTTLLLALTFVHVSNGSTEPSLDASNCLQGFADPRSLPVKDITQNASLYNVLPYGLHLFPNMKFQCDGSVKGLKIVLFYTTDVNDRWERVPSVELLQLLSPENYRNCSDDTLNCYRLSFTIEHNLANEKDEAELFDIQCSNMCIKFRSNTVLTVSMNFSTPMTVKRGDYLGLVVPPLVMTFEDALPIVYTGSNYESPFIAIPQGSFIPSVGWEEQLRLAPSLNSNSASSADCSWATGAITGILVVAVVAVGILGAITVIMWRRKHNTKVYERAVVNVANTEVALMGNPAYSASHTLNSQRSPGVDDEMPAYKDPAVGNVADTAGDSLPSYIESAEYAVAGDVIALNDRPLPQLPSDSEVTEAQEDIYWCPADTEEGIHQQMKQKKFLNLVDKLVSLENKLGEGEFGEVYRGLWKVAGQGNPMEVAVKVPKGNSDENRIKVLQEAAILGQFNHPRVARLCGMVTLGNPVMMVMELLPNGDLSDYVKELNYSPKDPDLPKKLLQFCLEIADGMSYLSKKCFVHRDLAARNILLDKEWHCKITDFGMSHNLGENAYYTIKGGRIPLRWTAPEAILYRKYTTKSDVWSYGMVMYEIWSLGHRPFEDFSVEEILEALRSAYCQPPPPGCPREVYEVMVDCWTPTTDDRPDFPCLMTTLELVESEAKKIFHWGEDDSVAMKLGAPLEEGAEMYKELQNKHYRSN